MSIFFFNDTATTEIYTLSLHDALPIYKRRSPSAGAIREGASVTDIVLAYERGGAAALSILTEPFHFGGALDDLREDRKSTRLNSSHANISYAVFCLKKNKILHPHITCL